jgi:SAM-dependent methyltransferase
VRRGARVVGVDVSELMVSVAHKRNSAEVARGDVDVRVGEASTLALEGESFDRVFAVHSIYFWRDVDAAISRIAAALREGGRLVLAFRPDGDGIPARFRDPTYRFPRLQELRGSLERAGLSHVSEASSEADPNVVILIAVRATRSALLAC